IVHHRNALLDQDAHRARRSYMRTAVICLAYMRSAAGVELLANYLARTSADLYVHVDAKSDPAPYVNAAAQNPSIRLIAQRHAIFWGGFNTIRAMVAGLEAARATADYWRFVFLTEDTIPIVSPAEFDRRMSSDAEFIETKPTSNPAIWDRYNRYFFLDSFATTPRPCRTVEREITAEHSRALYRMDALRSVGKVPLSDLRHGGTWWALTKRATERFLTSYWTDARLRESFEFSAISEEQYPHTVLGDLGATAPALFADWSRTPTPFVFRTAAEIATIDSKGATFLRKVQVGEPSIQDFVLSLA
ncbi:beta-1,6-N-acetylglucosaminyltransferase, partial [Nostoc sp. NIES-2111]